VQTEISRGYNLQRQNFFRTGLFLLLLQATALGLFAVPVGIKAIHISRSTSEIVLDGRLDESAWLLADPAADFH